MAMELDEASKAKMSIRRPECAVIFIKVDENNMKAIELFPGNMELFTLPDVKPINDVINELLVKMKENEEKKGGDK